jgi:hypothetical protein
MPGRLSTIEENDILHVSGAGLWAPTLADRHFRELHQLVLRRRAAQQSVLVLVDLTQAPVQTVETAQVIHEQTGRIYREADRVAVVCATMLLALQIKHAAKIGNMSTFEAVEPALLWLRAA